MADDPAPLRVLLADDASVMRLLLRTILRRYISAEFSEAVDGPGALKLATERTFDMVFLDVNMPRMNGLSVLEALRRMPAYAHTPIVLITALGQERHRERGMALGASAYVLKPLREMELVRALARLAPQALQSETRGAGPRDRAKKPGGG